MSWVKQLHGPSLSETEKACAKIIQAEGRKVFEILRAPAKAKRVKGGAK